MAAVMVHPTCSLGISAFDDGDLPRVREKRTDQLRTTRLPVRARSVTLPQSWSRPTAQLVKPKSVFPAAFSHPNVRWQRDSSSLRTMAALQHARSQGLNEVAFERATQLIILDRAYRSRYD